MPAGGTERANRRGWPIDAPATRTSSSSSTTTTTSTPSNAIPITASTPLSRSLPCDRTPSYQTFATPSSHPETSPAHSSSLRQGFSWLESYFKGRGSHPHPDRSVDGDPDFGERYEVGNKVRGMGARLNTNAEELGRGIPNTPIGRGSVAGSSGGSEDDLTAEDVRAGSVIDREDLETGAGNEAIGDGVGRARRSSTRDRDGNGRSNARHRRWSSRGVEEGNGHDPEPQPEASTSSATSTTASSSSHPPSHDDRSKWSFYPTLVLENTGSVARDHLASERTFLAYVRTSLAFASAGVALVQLFAITSDTLVKYARPMGATIILIGFGLLFIGTTRYFRVQNALTQGYFPAARISIAFNAVLLCALIIVVFAIILQVRAR